MKPYHKIQTIFLRSPESNFKKLMEGHWAKPEFELLKDIPWIWTEKIDGTNIRIIWENGQVQIKGKSDDADIPVFLLNKLEQLFTPARMQAAFADTHVCLYGEGYGNRIQKGSNYIKNDTDFILFDCRVGYWWFTEPSLVDVAAKLGIKKVPVVGSGTLPEAIAFARAGFRSHIAQNNDYLAEGLIVKPKLELFDRAGERIIAKIKHRDFDA